MRISDWSSDVCSSDLIAVVYVGRTTRNIASVKWHAKGWSGGDGVIDRRGEPGRVDFEQRRSRRSFAGARPISAKLQREARIRKSTRLNSSHLCSHGMPSFVLILKTCII